MTVVLDAWAVVALLKDEPAGPRVAAEVEARRPVMSVVNLGEVLYTLARAAGEERALAAVEQVRSRVRLVEATWEITLHAARLKVAHPLSYADAFCVATALEPRLPLWTGDPEILALSDVVEVVDLRP